MDTKCSQNNFQDIFYSNLIQNVLEVQLPFNTFVAECAFFLMNT